MLRKVDDESKCSQCGGYVCKSTTCSGRTNIVDRSDTSLRCNCCRPCDITTFEAEVNSLRILLKDQGTEVFDTLGESITKQGDDISNLQQDYDALSQNIDQAFANNDELAKHVEELQEENAKLFESVEELRKMNIELVTHIVKLQDRDARIFDHIEKLNERYADMMERHTEMTEKNAVMVQSLIVRNEYLTNMLGQFAKQ